MLQWGPESTVILHTATIAFRFATSPHNDFVLGLCDVAWSVLGCFGLYGFHRKLPNPGDVQNKRKSFGHSAVFASSHA